MQSGRNFLKVKDQVEIIAGKDKGRVGKITRLYTKTNRAIVERANMIKRHTKPTAANQQGQIVEKEAPIHVSNLKLVCPKCTKTVKVTTRTLEDGTKERVCKKCNETIESKA
jgi:large subunit ribosomal protein L24